jgi:flagella basal body P-ring formation protein FlgA
MLPIASIPAAAGALALGLAFGGYAAAASPEGTAALQSRAAIERAVEAFLQRETRALPGAARFAVGPLEERLALPACPALEVSAAPGARLIGRTSVLVRCSGPARWQIYVPVTVSVTVPYVAAARALAPGQSVQPEDLVLLSAPLEQLPAGVLSDPQRALGRIAVAGIAAGQPVREEALRAPLSVRPGQRVRLLARGPGFEVSYEGQALGQAASGQWVQVRVPSGQVVSGRAREDGVVEVPF